MPLSHHTTGFVNTTEECYQHIATAAVCRQHKTVALYWQQLWSDTQHRTGGSINIWT